MSILKQISYWRRNLHQSHPNWVRLYTGTGIDPEYIRVLEQIKIPYWSWNISWPHFNLWYYYFFNSGPKIVPTSVSVMELFSGFPFIALGGPAVLYSSRILRNKPVLGSILAWSVALSKDWRSGCVVILINLGSLYSPACRITTERRIFVAVTFL